MKNLIVLLLLLPSALYALEKKDVESKLGIKLKEFNKSPVKGLYELVTKNNKIYYIDETGRYIVEGSIGDLVNKVSITQQRLDELSKIDFTTLP
ncbi:MAG: disulfide isomerase DsbC N-terminal domain-containing protein, partial [Nitrospinota bacterium]